MPEPRDPTFLKAPPSPPPGKDPYRTAGRPTRPASAPFEPEAPEAPEPPEPAARPQPAGDDPREAQFRRKLEAARAAARYETRLMFWAAVVAVVIGAALLVLDYFTPGRFMLRRNVPAPFVIIPCMVLAGAYLVHCLLRRLQGRSP